MTSFVKWENFPVFASHSEAAVGVGGLSEILAIEKAILELVGGACD